jgi:hypothetical protein
LSFDHVKCRFKALLRRTTGKKRCTLAVYLLTQGFSSGAFSLLPAVPGIFYGRESELEKLTVALRQSAARVAILGTGGMGKTTLALAVLHHPEIEQQYTHRHFIMRISN